MLDSFSKKAPKNLLGMLALKIIVFALTVMCRSDALQVDKAGKGTDQFHLLENLLNEENRNPVTSGLWNTNENGITGMEEGKE